MGTNSSTKHNDDFVFVVGLNDQYQFGLNHNKNIFNLTNWSEINKMTIDQINCCHQNTIFKDYDGNYMSSGYNIHGECAINAANIPHVKQCREIAFFKQNNIKINKICTNHCSSSIFWISDKNKVYGNGSNTYHQVGTHDSDNRYQPELIQKLEGSTVIDAACGKQHSLALCVNINNYMIRNIISYWYKSDATPNDIINIILKYTKGMNKVYGTGSCHWSAHQSFGANGIGRNVKKWTNIQLLNDKDIIKVKCGKFHSLFLSQNGTLFGCGYNKYGQLYGYPGNAVLQITTIYYFIRNNIKILDIACGDNHNLAIDYDKRIYSWGSNKFGECGHHRNPKNTEPKLIETLKDYNIKNIKCGSSHSYAMSDDGKHFLFGCNENNQCLLITQFGKNIVPKIYRPFCINEVINTKTKGKIIKDIHLGNHSTIIIVKDADTKKK